MSTIIVGPLLGLESDTQYTVCFSTEKSVTTPQVHVKDKKANNQEPVICKKVATTKSSVIWRAAFVVPKDARNRRVQYQITVGGSVACTARN